MASEILACTLTFFRIPHPFLSKCILWMRKNEHNPDFFDGRKFQTPCAMTLTVDVN